METLINQILKNIEQGVQPELAYVADKARNLHAFATGEGYNCIIEDLFKHETNLEIDGNKVLDWRISKSNCGTRPLINLINQQINNIIQNARAEEKKIRGKQPAKRVMEIMFDDFYAGKSIPKIAAEIVNQYAIHSPFDWLVLDVAGSYTELELPIVKPFIVSTQSLINLQYEAGEVSALTYVLTEFDDDGEWTQGKRYVYIDKDITAIFTKTLEKGKSLESYGFNDFEDITPEDNVIISNKYDNYKVVISVRHLPSPPVMPIGFVNLDSDPIFQGNEFCAVSELLERYARYDSEIVCIIDKYIKPEEIRLVEKPKPSLAAFSENSFESRLKERSSVQTTEIVVDDLEDALQNGYLAHFDKMVIQLTPEFETLNKLIEQRESVKKEIERTILGVEIFDRQQTALTATEKRLELQAKENVAGKRLRKQEELIYFLFNSTLSIYASSLVTGFTYDDLPELDFSYPYNLQIQTSSELLDEYKKSKEMGAPQDLVRNILRKYRHVVFLGNLEKINEEEVWDIINPFRNILVEDWWAKYQTINESNTEYSINLWKSWQFVLAQYEPAIRQMVETNYPAFYKKSIANQFVVVKAVVEEFINDMLFASENDEDLQPLNQTQNGIVVNKDEDNSTPEVVLNPEPVKAN